MSHSIKSKILKTENVNWRELINLQPDSFKELSVDAYNKLKKSILNNDFVTPFVVWEDSKTKEIFLIDGVHRVKVLNQLAEEGHAVPKIFPAVFLNCKNRKEASKLVLVYSSQYAVVTTEGMDEFINLESLNLDELKFEIDIPKLDMRYFNDPADFTPAEMDEKQKLDEKHKVCCPNCGSEFEPR